MLIAGAGFAGFHCARELERLLRPDEAELTLASPVDYMLYNPLLPQVAAGVITPQAAAVALRRALRRTSRVVMDYYDRAGLTPWLDRLGFSLVGYGCTTCIGNSGPLIPARSSTGCPRSRARWPILATTR